MDRDEFRFRSANTLACITFDPVRSDFLGAAPAGVSSSAKCNAIIVLPVSRRTFSEGRRTL